MSHWNENIFTNGKKEIEVKIAKRVTCYEKANGMGAPNSLRPLIFSTKMLLISFFFFT